MSSNTSPVIRDRLITDWFYLFACFGLVWIGLFRFYLFALFCFCFLFFFFFLGGGWGGWGEVLVLALFYVPSTGACWCQQRKVNRQLCSTLSKR